MKAGTLGPCAAAIALLLCGPLGDARAQLRDDGARVPAETAARSAQAGMFLPYTMAARTDSQRAFVLALGGYDQARRSAQLESTADATLFGPLAARAGVLYGQSGHRMRPSAGLRVQALSQNAHYLDLSLGAFYRPEGFTEAEGEVEAVLAFGRSFGRLGTFANLVYGQDPEGNERDGEVRVAALYTLGARVQSGLDLRLRFDLGSAQGARRVPGEADYDFVAGPVLSYALGPMALLAQLGLSAVGQSHPRLGPVALAGLGGAL